MYDKLADLIEQHRRTLGQLIIGPAVLLHVIDGTQNEVDAAGFELSFQAIADSVRTGNSEIFQNYVAQGAINQMERGVSHQQVIEVGDHMFWLVGALVEREFPGAENAARRERFHRRLQGLHSLGKITVVNTQIRYS